VEARRVAISLRFFHVPQFDDSDFVRAFQAVKGQELTVWAEGDAAVRGRMRCLQRTGELELRAGLNGHGRCHKHGSEQGP
jgi:hypothetical protein